MSTITETQAKLEKQRARLAYLESQNCQDEHLLRAKRDLIAALEELLATLIKYPHTQSEDYYDSLDYTR